MSAKIIAEFYGWGTCAVLWNNCGNCPDSPEIAKTALGSTVHLEIFDAQGKPLARGSGFFVAPNQIATNYHVIEDLK